MVLKKVILIILIAIWGNTAYADDLLLGFYTFPAKQDIDMLAGSTFKYLMPYGTDGKGEAFLEDYLNHAKMKGVRIIFSLKDAYKESRWYPKTHWCSTDRESELVSCIVGRFKDYESVCGWYLSDEPTDTVGLRNKEKIKANAEAIKRLSSKPIFVEDYPIPKGKMWDYLDSFSNVLMTTSYPVPEKNLSDAYEVIKELISNSNKNVIAVLQIFGKYQYPHYKRDKITGRAPSHEEIRVMSYLSLIAGAKGIMYFSLPDIKKLPDFKERWDFLIKLGGELKENYQLIASREKPSNGYNVKTQDGIFYLIRHFKERDYLIAVNATEKNRHPEISKKGGFIKKITLNPLEVKVLLLSDILEQ